jgi:thiamine pyrophosphokinase
MHALLVCASPEPGAPAFVRELAASADIAVAVDGGGAVCLEAGVVPAVVLGDFDSLPADTLDALTAAGARIVRYPADKDRTDLALALAEVRALGATTVTVTAASGGRLDHTLGVLATLVENRDLSPMLAEPSSRSWILGSDARRALQLEGPGAVVSLIPYGGSALVSATGLRWPLTDTLLGVGDTLGVSNVISTTAALVEAHDGVVLVVSPAVGECEPARER